MLGFARTVRSLPLDGSTARLDPDRELIEAVRRREASALGSLYDRYGSTVFPVCLRILRDRSEAEEVLGDVFHELWNRPESFDPSRGNLPAFLVLLARSRSIDRLRSKKRREAVVVSSDRESTGVAGEPVDRAETSPLENAMLAQRRSRIRAAMGVLAPEVREVVELAFYSDLSHGEISRELQQPLGTVKGRIRNGLIRLRDALRTVYEDEGIV